MRLFVGGCLLARKYICLGSNGVWLHNHVKYPDRGGLVGQVPVVSQTGVMDPDALTEAAAVKSDAD